MVDKGVIEVLGSMIPTFDVRDKSKVQGVLGVLYVLAPDLQNDAPNKGTFGKVNKLVTELDSAITAIDQKRNLENYSNDAIKARLTEIVKDLS